MTAKTTKHIALTARRTWCGRLRSTPGLATASARDATCGACLRALGERDRKTQYVVMNPEGRYLCIPETPRHGSRGRVRPLPPEWGDLDHAARFDTEAAAKRGAAEAGARKCYALLLTGVWRESEARRTP